MTLIKNLVLLKVLAINCYTSFHRSVGTKMVLMYCYIDNLKQLLISVWAKFKQSVIDKAIDQCRPRLRACVYAF